jgi:hypothetical protein
MGTNLTFLKLKFLSTFWQCWNCYGIGDKRCTLGNELHNFNMNRIFLNRWWVTLITIWKERKSVLDAIQMTPVTFIFYWMNWFIKFSEKINKWNYWYGHTKGMLILLTVWKVKLSLCLTKHHAMKLYLGNGGIAPRIHNPDDRWRWVVSFTPRSLYPQGKSPWYPPDRRLCGFHSYSEAVVKKKILSCHRESNPKTRSSIP